VSVLPAMTKVTGLVGAEIRSPKLDSLAGHLTHCRPLGLSGQPLDSEACVLRLLGADEGSVAWCLLLGW